MGHYYTLTTYILELEGKPAGKIYDVRFPQVRGEIIANVGDHVSPKQIRLEPNDFSFSCGAGMSRDFFDWIKDTFKSNFNRKNGAIVGLDNDRNEKVRVEFNHALITSVQLPKLDKRSNEASFIDVKIKSEDTKNSPGGGKTSHNPYLAGIVSGVGGFKMAIDKLEKECESITQIDPITVGSRVEVDYPGNSRIPVMVPSSATISELTLSVPDSSSKGFLDWFQESVTSGVGDAGERSGTLEYRASDGKTAYFVLGLTGIGVFSASTQERQSTIKVYCDSVDFSATSSAIR